MELINIETVFESKQLVEQIFCFGHSQEPVYVWRALWVLVRVGTFNRQCTFLKETHALIIKLSAEQFQA